MCWGSYDSDYRGLKKRITAIRRAQGSSAGSHINVSSESELDIFPRESGASAHGSDGEEIVDEGHDADNETSILSGRPTQQTVVDARDGEIEFKELNHGHSKVDTVCFFSYMHSIFSQGRDLFTSRYHFCLATTTSFRGRARYRLRADARDPTVGTTPTRSAPTGWSA